MTGTTMIERLTDILVARCERISEDRLRVTARVLVEAMREPTAAMSAAGAKQVAEDGFLIGDPTARWTWGRMIDAALAEEG